MSSIIFIFIFFAFSEDSPEKSQFEKLLEKDQSLLVHESIVVVNQVPYYKIEAEGKFHYFKVLQRKDDIPKYLCDRPEDWKSERLLEGSLKINKRTRAFFEALREKCTTRDRKYPLVRNQHKRHWVEVDPVVGIYISDDKEDKVKNKKIGVPLKNLFNAGPKGLMFMGDF